MNKLIWHVAISRLSRKTGASEKKSLSEKYIRRICDEPIFQKPRKIRRKRPSNAKFTVRRKNLKTQTTRKKRKRVKHHKRKKETNVISAETKQRYYIKYKFGSRDVNISVSNFKGLILPTNVIVSNDQ